MTHREFFYLVAQMREAQANYFLDRTQQKLRRCKVLERDVDAEILRVKQIIREREKDQADEYANNSGLQYHGAAVEIY